MTDFYIEILTFKTLLSDYDRGMLKYSMTQINDNLAVAAIISKRSKRKNVEL